MAKEESSLITRVSEEAWKITEKLSAACANMSPPAPLEGYAKELRVRCVRFEPLLSGGGLARSGKDFEIVLNTEAPGSACPAGTKLSADDGKWGELKPLRRFSIAHEIAHAVFLKAVGYDSRLDLFRKNERAVENACNILARIFLLPRSMLVREIDGRLFDVDHLGKLVHAFGVSPEVFLRRFHVSDMRGQFTTMDGLLAFIQEKGENIEFKACHMWGDHAIARFQHPLQESRKKASEYQSLSADYKQTRWALEGLKLNEIGLRNSSDIAFRLKNEQADHIEMDVEWARGEVTPCNLSFRMVREKPLGWLLCLEFMSQGHLF